MDSRGGVEDSIVCALDRSRDIGIRVEVEDLKNILILMSSSTGLIG